MGLCYNICSATLRHEQSRLPQEQIASRPVVVYAGMLSVVNSARTTAGQVGVGTIIHLSPIARHGWMHHGCPAVLKLRTEQKSPL